MNIDLPPILQEAERLIVEMSGAVKGWGQFHKYGLGSELRKDCRDVFRYANRAWRDQARRSEWLEQLEWQIDELKCSLRVGQHDKAFTSAGQFKVLITLADELGKMCGGWKKEHRKGQNHPSSKGERAQTLSARAASTEANP